MHDIPDIIKNEAEIALSYYPKFKDLEIRFIFKENIKKSTMQAQPSWRTFLPWVRTRSYVILISETFKISGDVFKTVDVPKDVMIGWIGHELGHVMDYENRSRRNLVGFGFMYLFSSTYIQGAERAADTYAVRQGMRDYIMTTKRFILDHASISPEYKARIKRLYLSPEDIMQIVEE